MRIAILYKKDKVLVEYTPSVFKKLLIKYFKKTKDIENALDLIVEDIKRETKYL